MQSLGHQHICVILIFSQTSVHLKIYYALAQSLSFYMVYQANHFLSCFSYSQSIFRDVNKRGSGF